MTVLNIDYFCIYLIKVYTTGKDHPKLACIFNKYILNALFEVYICTKKLEISLVWGFVEIDLFCEHWVML